MSYTAVEKWSNPGTSQHRNIQRAPRPRHEETHYGGINIGIAPRLSYAQLRQEREMRFQGVHNYAQTSQAGGQNTVRTRRHPGFHEALAQRSNTKDKASCDHSHSAVAASASTGRPEAWPSQSANLTQWHSSSWPISCLSRWQWSSWNRQE